MWAGIRKRILPYLGLYIFYGIIMTWLHPRFIYPFQPNVFENTAFPRQEIAIPHADPLPVHVHDAGPGAPVVVYFMGNVGALELFVAMLDHHRSQGRSVVAMAYRGGGGEAGAPSERQMKADAVHVMDALPTLVADPGPVVVHGFSLGTGLALHVAARPDVDGVLLSAPYDRLCALMAARAYLPACYMPGIQAWRSGDFVEGITAPVLILHGEDDSLIAPKHSARLATHMEAAQVDVTRTLFPDGGHNDLMSVPGYLEAIDAFVAGQQN